MTIQDVAEQYKVTPQAVYKRLKSAGIDVKTLKDGETGGLTEDSKAVFEKLFNSEGLTKRGNINQQNEGLKAENETLKRLVDKLESENRELKNRVDELKEDKENIRRALEQAQAVQLALTNRLLPEPDEQKTNKPGLWQRITGRRK